MAKATAKGVLMRVRWVNAKLVGLALDRALGMMFALTHCILVTAHLFNMWLKFAQAFFISGIWAYFQVLIVFLLPQQARILNLNDLFSTNPLYFDSPWLTGGETSTKPFCFNIKESWSWLKKRLWRTTVPPCFLCLLGASSSLREKSWWRSQKWS